VQLLRHQADERARGAVIAPNVVTVRDYRSRRGGDNAADDVDQRRLARAIGAEERENLALANFKVDLFQRLQAGGVGLGEIRDGKDRDIGSFPRRARWARFPPD